MTSWLDDLTPRQEELVDDLLGRGIERPGVPFDLAAELRAKLAEGLVEAASLIPEGEELWLGKTAIDALVCEGRYLDLNEQVFEWTSRMVAGRLTHKALEVDWQTDRSLPLDEAVLEAEKLLRDVDGIGDFFDGQTEVEAKLLRSESQAQLADFRDTWPVMPVGSSPRLEVAMRANFGDGRIKLSGKPDLLLGTASRHERRMVLIDFKTGSRRPMQERQDLRFYGLLATLKYGVMPWRWATYYTAEGRWDLEDASVDLLELAAARVIHSAERAARLKFATPAADALELVPGGWCRWCGRNQTCPSAELGQGQLDDFSR